MVMNLNKREFISELAHELSYPEEKCMLINEILESNFFISKKNKDKIIEALIQKLDIHKEEAINIYNTAIMIIKKEVKNKLKHPFKSIE